MLFSASRRTDIPTYYSEWLCNRLEAGNVCVRHDARRVTRYVFSREAVDCLVLWTKNPLPLLDRLALLRGWPCVFQFTLTGYGRDVEPGLPDKLQLVEAMKRLSEAFGSERVIWRYDPVFLTDQYSAAFHQKAFSQLARALKGVTVRCIISFLDWYSPMERRFGSQRPQMIDEGQMQALAAAFGQTAAENGMRIFTCAETADLSGFGLEHGCCIDRELLEQIGGRSLDLGKDRGQRAACGCAMSIDIGAYDTCPGGCLYCYADHGAGRTAQHLACFDPHSPLLCSRLGPADIVRERKMKSSRVEQTSLFERPDQK